MKRTYFTFLLLFVLWSSYGQINTVIPKLGATFSSTKDMAEDPKYKPGYLLGVSAGYRLDPKISFIPELLLEQKGFYKSVAATDMNGQIVGSFDVYYTWNYLTLPIQLRYYPLKNERFLLSAGGYAGYLVGATERTKGDLEGSEINNREKKDISDYNHWDYGINISAGTNIPFTEKSGIEVCFRYEHGLNFASDRIPTPTQTFSLSVGYIIGVSR